MCINYYFFKFMFVVFEVFPFFGQNFLLCVNMGRGFCTSMGMHLKFILLSIHKGITCECLNFTLLEFR